MLYGIFVAVHMFCNIYATSRSPFWCADSEFEVKSSQLRSHEQDAQTGQTNRLIAPLKSRFRPPANRTKTHASNVDQGDATLTHMVIRSHAPGIIKSFSALTLFNTYATSVCILFHSMFTFFLFFAMLCRCVPLLLTASALDPNRSSQVLESLASKQPYTQEDNPHILHHSFDSTFNSSFFCRHRTVDVVSVIYTYHIKNFVSH